MPGEATNQNGQVSACSDHQAQGACTRREGSGRGAVSPGVFDSRASKRGISAPRHPTRSAPPAGGPLVELQRHPTRPGLIGALIVSTNALIGPQRGRAVDGPSDFDARGRNSWIRPFRSRRHGRYRWSCPEGPRTTKRSGWCLHRSQSRRVLASGAMERLGIKVSLGVFLCPARRPLASRSMGGCDRSWWMGCG